MSNKYHWLIAQSRVMAHEDIRLVLALDIENWSMLSEAQEGSDKGIEG
ncbi:hypothetical protein PHA77_09225 [Edwardsiella tarda]|nr:hypothetical protein [Edwardsiella tarda]WGE27693.1 hypothetical protein PHA77_09225 [Edwardsiella tarda]